MRSQSALFLVAVSSLGYAQTSPQTPAQIPLVQQIPATPMFSTAERDTIIAFWSRPDRYTVTIPDDAMDKGLWQVRLTVEGSTWLWNYDKARKVSAPPTATAAPANDEQKTWEAWVTARIARDRWLALQDAQRSNQKVLGKLLPAADAATPATEPPDPGVVPAALVALVGDPPPFAKAVVPMLHQVRFDDGALNYADNIRVWNQRYPYYRYSQGVASGGTAVKTMPPDRLDHLFKLAGVAPAEAKVMRAVSMLEGGFDSINTYDTGFVSVGFIQFACLKEGAGSLGGMLLDYKNNDAEDFQRDFRSFGIDVTPTGALAVLDVTTGAELTGADAAKRVIEDKRMIAVFQHAGQKSDAYVASQIRSAKTMFYPGNDTVTVAMDGLTLTGKVSDIIHSEAGLATLMDRKVNTGNIRVLAEAINQVAAEVKPKSLDELAKYEYEIVDRMRYRTNYLADSSLSQPAGNSRGAIDNSRGGGSSRSGRGGGKKHR